MLKHKAVAFIRRDFRIASSYRVAFIFEFLASVFPVFTFYFVAKLVGGGNARSLEKYGGDYFSFALIGVALNQYFMLALRTFAGAIRRSQMAGCLEAMLSTQTRPETIIVLSALYSFTVKTVHVALVLVVGGLVLGVSYSHANITSALATLVLTIITFSSLGILSAAFIIVLKKGDPIEWIFASMCSLLGGAFFPLAVMPSWLQRIAGLLPITHSLEAMRLAVFKGYSIAMLWKELAILGGMAVVLLPVGIRVFAQAVEKGRRDGSLMHY